MRNVVKKSKKIYQKNRAPFSYLQRKKNNKLYKNINNTKKLKKMNCNPLVEDKKVVAESCYTPDVLNQIKEYYNKFNESVKIISNDPYEIWLQLNKRLTHCKKEDCWLNEIKDINLKNKFDKYIFAPDYPKEWENNPNEWLSNFDILNVLKQYEDKYSEFEFIGPSAINFDEKVKEYNCNCVENKLCHFSLDSFLKKNKSKIGIIFNLDEHDEDGSHWVSLFIDIKEKIIFYFDSNGDQIPGEIQILKDRIIKQGNDIKPPITLNYIDNHRKTHQQGNTECGMYSLFFIITMLTSSTEFNKKMTMEDKLKLFKKTRIPDKYVEKYRKKYFNSPQ